jgi:hypothetical protein
MTSVYLADESNVGPDLFWLHSGHDAVERQTLIEPLRSQLMGSLRNVCFLCL